MPDDQSAPPQSIGAVVQAPAREARARGDECAIVIFGAFGDLTKRLVMPALYNLARTKALPDNFALIGVDMAEGTAESWATHLHDMLESFVGNASSEFNVDSIDEDVWKGLAARMSYVRGDITKPELYNSLAQLLETVAEQHSTGGNVIF